MKMRMSVVLGMCLLVASCGESKTNVVKSLHSLVELQEATAEQCANGGTVVLTGVDENESGALDPEEVANTQVICNGIHGQTPLVRADPEPAGVNCGEGGFKLSHGIDDNDDGVLDESEVDGFEYVCNGLPGSGTNSLVSVMEEAAGANCEHGGYGIRSGLDVNGDHLLQPAEVENTVYVCNGSDGMNSLIRREDEPAGGNCPFGGQAVMSGLDTDGNGYLDDMETQNTNYVCHGADGTDGIDGVNNLFETTTEPAGATCAAGGVWVISGPDTNRNDFLDADEIQVEEVICHGVNGTDGVDGADAYNSLVLVTPEAIGLNCATGGQKIQTGIDLDRDGVLDETEVTQTQYVCQGADGANGLPSLVKITPEAAGANCVNGGSKVESGLDANANVVLDVAEVQQTQFVCNGTDGLNGLDGTDGSDGADGLNGLVRVSTETAGLNCTAGGSKIETGLDLDADGVLDAGEVLQTQFVCHGIAGVDGGDGTDGANGLNSLVRVSAEPAGANCTVGGTKIETGLDADADGVLDPLEIAQTRYVCNGVNGADGSDGSDGAAGFNSLVKVSVVAAGVPCTTGGQKVETGLDLDRDNALDVAEVTQTQYVCHGLNGVDGGDGSDGLNSLVRVTTEPAGSHCANGGSLVETGIDLNTNGILDLGEVTQAQYVCNGVDGTDGLDGADGLAGINSLVRLTVEPVGLNCAAGGSKVESGLDTDADTILDGDEVTQTQYVCNGAAGADGTDGSDGSNGSNGLNSLVRITPEVIGANCAAAGNKIESGLDLNSNGILDVGEVTSTRYVCNGTDGADGADGADGSSNLLRATNAAWGGVCQFGGVKLETGFDTNGSGILDDPEVTQTQYVCNKFSTWAAISSGDNHTCGIKPDGSVWCWGNNSNGQLGDNSTNSRYNATAVSGLSSDVVFISAGNQHTCVLKTNGSAWCWGLNSSGEIGDNTTTQRNVPVAVNMPSGRLFSQITAGKGSYDNLGYHTCAIDTLGAAWCWGYNGYGEVGDNSTTLRMVPTAVLMPGTTTFNKITAGGYHTCAIDLIGAAWCWGGNFDGQLGDNSKIQHNVPNAVLMPSGKIFIQINAGGYHTCAIDNDGASWCWARNWAGQLGDNSTIDRLVPTAVIMPALKTFTQINSGVYYTCAIDNMGISWCWGQNNLGQLGNNTNTWQIVPTVVSMPADKAFIQITTGREHSCAIDTLGIAWCWGNNGEGQLGDGTSSNRNIPTKLYEDLAP